MRCYDCGDPSDDEVCCECLRLADAVDYEEHYCRAEHGPSCGCWELSEAALAYEMRKTTPLETVLTTYAEVCMVPAHAPLKTSHAAFERGTQRLPHMPHCEAYQSDGDGHRHLIRNCRCCGSTLSMPVAMLVRDAAKAAA